MPVWPALKSTISLRGDKIDTSNILSKGGEGTLVYFRKPITRSPGNLLQDSGHPVYHPQRTHDETQSCILRWQFVCSAELGQKLILNG